MEKKNGKSGSKSQTKKRNPSKGNVLLVFESSLLSSTASTVSSKLLTDFLLAASSPSLLSVVSKTSSLSLTTSNIKKRLVLDSPDNHRTSKPKKKAHCIESMMNEELKLVSHNVDWLNSTLTKNKCLKHTSKKNLPVSQEGQLTFLLGKYQTSEIKTAFADAIGKVGTAARKAFYPLPLCNEKLMSSFLELIHDGKSIMVDNSKDSFR
jgi:hypothetical protein